MNVDLKDSKLIFSITITDFVRMVVTESPPSGYTLWSLNGVVKQLIKGNLENQPGSSFSTSILTYSGTAENHPQCLWMSETLKANQTWIIYCNSNLKTKVEDVIKGKGEDCLATREL